MASNAKVVVDMDSAPKLIHTKMKRLNVIRILLLLLTVLGFSHTVAAQENRKILMGVSNVADMGDPDKHPAKNNLWEVAPAYHIFRMFGYEVDFVSPQGGKVPFSRDADETDPVGVISYIIKYEQFREKSDNTLTPDQANPDDYAGYFVAGGEGPLFDVAVNPEILAIAASIYEDGGAVGGCGHGPGSLANIVLSDGSYLVDGIRVTGFPNSTELNSRWTLKGTLLPFLVEDQLRLRGGDFQTKEDLADKFDVLADQRVVTTMFLSSCAIAARKLVESIAP